MARVGTTTPGRKPRVADPGWSAANLPGEGNFAWIKSLLGTKLPAGADGEREMKQLLELHPQLLMHVYEYVRRYNGSFPLLMSAKNDEATGKGLTLGQLKGVVNTIRANPNPEKDNGATSYQKVQSTRTGGCDLRLMVDEWQPHSIKSGFISEEAASTHIKVEQVKSGTYAGWVFVTDMARRDSNGRGKNVIAQLPDGNWNVYSACTDAILQRVEFIATQNGQDWKPLEQPAEAKVHRKARPKKAVSNKTPAFEEEAQKYGPQEDPAFEVVGEIDFDEEEDQCELWGPCALRPGHVGVCKDGNGQNRPGRVVRRTVVKPGGILAAKFGPKH